MNQSVSSASPLTSIFFEVLTMDTPHREKRENREQITSWMVEPYALFSPSPFFAVYSICWVYHGKKIITLSSALKERQFHNASKKKPKSQVTGVESFCYDYTLPFVWPSSFSLRLASPTDPDFCVFKKRLTL